MADEFKPGDVVQLKSGGPFMTIIKLAAGTADCEWFDDKKNPQERRFAVTSLKLRETPQRAQAGGASGSPWG
jgi:uncharacterized protein YodC (DUF2158 family)